MLNITAVVCRRNVRRGLVFLIFSGGGTIVVGVNSDWVCRTVARHRDGGETKPPQYKPPTDGTDGATHGNKTPSTGP